MTQTSQLDHTTAAERTPLAALRDELARRGLTGFVVPRGDEHQGEYVPPSAMRLAWLTGFSGSAGVAVVLTQRAALFIDGRYTLQAAAEVDSQQFSLHHLVDEPPHVWLARALGEGARLGYDPWLHTPNGVEHLREACAKAGAELVACADNPLDAVWLDRPAPPLAPVVPHPLDLSGRTASDKRAEIAALLTADKVAAAVLSAPDSIAWLLNLRGGDVPFTPLPLSFALIHADASVDLFIDPRKLSPGLRGHLGDTVRLAEPAEFGPALDRLAGKLVRLDPAGAPAWVLDRLTAAQAPIQRAADPCLLPKACKTAAELDGSRAAHLRDGVALAKFLCWLDAHAAGGAVTEIAASDQLEVFRQQGILYRGPSFPTISGAGPNGAIVHYRSTPETDRLLEPGQLYLVDSGGQYLDGTTDVTRTIAIGAVGDEEKRRFTLVLKGHVALAAARFPAGTTGSQLDCLARRALWAEGLDYDHGTGHGVGSYLSVHEGPQRVSKTPSPQALLPGMILSDEPGYYKTGGYGIRIENLVVVTDDGITPGFRAFEVLTLAPIDLAATEVGLLDAVERDWLNAYHRRVRDTLTPLLDATTAQWLEKATREV
ncbi:MAG TPA: aminopeptidase P family protein [Patescibacteria group bacterium]|nr:aminopeptidase P family protein [Patescibacteria group bacterium]